MVHFSDLEDSIAPAAKRATREAVASALAAGTIPHNVVIRVNTGQDGLDDITAIGAAASPTLMIPKCDSAALELVAGHLHAAGHDAGVWALVESATGLRDIHDIACHRLVERLAIGEADLCAELGITSRAAHGLWPLRMQLVTASACAELPGPLGPINTDYTDIATLEDESIALRDAGFGGRLAIHPAQIPPIHRAFTPTEEAAAAAQRIVAIHAHALASAQGVAVDDDGRMIDEAIVRTARRVLRLAPPKDH